MIIKHFQSRNEFRIPNNLKPSIRISAFQIRSSSLSKTPKAWTLPCCSSSHSRRQHCVICHASQTNNFDGPGDFEPGEFELIQELGTISIQRSESISEISAAQLKFTQAAVIAYVGSYTSTAASFQDPVVTLIKEYLPSSLDVARNELKVLTHLTGGLPSDKYAAAASGLSKLPPIVEILGYFKAGNTPSASRIDPSVETAAEDSYWIVQKWDSLAPLAMYPSSEQQVERGLGLFNKQSGDRALKYRKQMLKAIIKGMLEAVAFCHELGVAHGGLGGGSFLLNTFSDKKYQDVVVKLDNFGFAKMQLDEGDLDGTFLTAKANDLRQLALVVLETIFSALSDGPGNKDAANNVSRVMGEVFNWDVKEYSEYMREDPEAETAVRFLDDDDGAGWELVKELMGGLTPALELLEAPFLQ